MENAKLGFMREHAISGEEVSRLVTYCRRNLAVGIELETEFRNKPTQDDVAKLFKVQKKYTYVNNEGVVHVCTDASVPDGYEVIMVGTNEAYDDYHGRIVRVEEKLSSCGTKRSPKCSMHMSILLKQCKMLPGVVVKNFYQLFRAYSDSLLWLTSATYRRANTGTDDERDWIVRPDQSRFATVNIPLTPARHGLRDLKEFCSKYRAINLAKLRYDSTGENCGELFIEVRIPDRHFVPHATTSTAFLWLALFLKAVSLSEFGLLTIEEEPYAKTKSTASQIQSGRPLERNAKAYLRDKATALIHFLHEELSCYGDQCVSVLSALARSPVSIRYRQRRSDPKIEEELDALLDRPVVCENALTLKKIMALAEVSAKTADQWKQQVAEQLHVSKRTVERYISELSKHVKCSFNTSTGSYVCAVQG